MLFYENMNDLSFPPPNFQQLRNAQGDVDMSTHPSYDLDIVLKPSLNLQTITFSELDDHDDTFGFDICQCSNLHRAYAVSTICPCSTASSSSPSLVYWSLNTPIFNVTKVISLLHTLSNARNFDTLEFVFAPEKTTSHLLNCWSLLFSQSTPFNIFTPSISNMYPVLTLLL
jgi:hypothetical protein